MTDIPAYPGMTPEQAFQRLQDWYQKQAQLKSLKSHEHLERAALSEYYFPNQVEGTNRLELGGGFDLKLQAGFNYKVTEEDLDNVSAADIKKHKLPWDDLFIYKPELSISTYRTLTAEQKAFVDSILTIKPASPQLEIVPGANREGQAAHVAAAEAAAGNADASGSPAAASPATEGGGDERVVVLDAEKAEPGQFYHDGENWWQLDDDVEWQEVVDLVEIGILDAQLADLNAKPAKPKRGRKSTK